MNIAFVAPPSAAAIRDRTSTALAEPRIVQLEAKLVAVSLEVMKIIPARYIIDGTFFRRA